MPVSVLLPAMENGNLSIVEEKMPVIGKAVK